MGARTSKSINVSLRFVKLSLISRFREKNNANSPQAFVFEALNRIFLFAVDMRNQSEILGIEFRMAEIDYQRSASKMCCSFERLNCDVFWEFFISNSWKTRYNFGPQHFQPSWRFSLFIATIFNTDWPKNDSKALISWRKVNVNRSKMPKIDRKIMNSSNLQGKSWPFKT